MAEWQGKLLFEACLVEENTGARRDSNRVRALGTELPQRLPGRLGEREKRKTSGRLSITRDGRRLRRSDGY